VTATPLVSVIIPCHGRPDLLAETLRSVADQTHPAVEVLVIDDASPRDLRTVVDSIDWPATFAVRFHRLGTNRGPGGAREAGRRLATGSYLCYLDSDDICRSDRFETQIAAFEENPAAAMCYSPVPEFHRLPVSGDEPLRAGSDEPHDRFLPRILYGRPWCTSACLWRREATDRIGPWFEGWTWEDYEYDCRAGGLDLRIAFVPAPLTFYRVSTTGERLSEIDTAIAARRRFESLMRITNTLERHQMLADVDIRDRIVTLLYGAALRLLDAEALNQAAKCALRARRIAKNPSVSHFAAFSLQLSCRLLPAKAAARLGRILRRRLMVTQSHPNGPNTS